VDFAKRDLQDSSSPVTAATVLRDYGGGRKRLRVYRSWVPIEEVPSARLAEVETAEEERQACRERQRKLGWPEPDEEGHEDCSETAREIAEGYAWDDLHMARTVPPAKLRVRRDGRVEILDGNHRLTLWEERGMAYVPAWVLDERPAHPRGRRAPVRGNPGRRGRRVRPIRNPSRRRAPPRPNRGDVGTGGGTRPARVSYRRAFTRDGVPWPEHTQVFHATGALGAIGREGFRTREQGAFSTLGGRFTRSVSLTLSWPRACAIAVGLDTLVRGMKRLMGCRELLDRLLVEVPGAFPTGVRSAYDLQELMFGVPESEGIATLRRVFSALDRGWYLGHAWDAKAPPSRHAAKLRGNFWLVPHGEVPDAVRRGAEKHGGFRWYGRAEVFYETYRNVLRWAGKGAFDPNWLTKDPARLATLDLRDIGVVVGRVGIPRVCAGSFEAIRLGYLTEKSREIDPRSAEMIDANAHSCREALETGLVVSGDSLGDDYALARARAPLVGHGWGYEAPDPPGWHTVDAGQRCRSCTMEFKSHEEELIVYDPRSIHIKRVVRMPELRRLTGIGDRITFPWFDARAQDIRVWGRERPRRGGPE
jgi:hypothetical protein